MPELNCQHCGETFVAKSARAKWCSEKCRTLHRRPPRNGLMYETICRQCGGTFMAKTTRANFCTSSCLQRARRAQNPGKYREYDQNRLTGEKRIKKNENRRVARALNIEAHREADRLRHMQNREKRLASMRARYLNDPQKRRDKAKAERLSDPDGYRARKLINERKRRAQIADAQAIEFIVTGEME